MKALITIVALAAIGYVSYLSWENYTHSLNADGAVPAHAAAVPAPAAPVPEPLVAEATPAQRLDLAPKGTYFLLQRVSITTDSGVTGVAPGTKVTLVSSGPPMRVSDGENEFEVTAGQVTNDLGVASRAFYSDQAAQAAIKEARAQEAQEYSSEEQSLQQQQQQQMLAAIKRRKQQEQDQASNAGWQNPLNQSAHAATQPDSYENGNPVYSGAIH